MKRQGFILIVVLWLAPYCLMAAPLDLSPAKWIWYPSERTLQNTFILFRKEINIATGKPDARGWIIADSRYQLFVNGKRVQWGPAPSDPRWQEADPVDITEYLVPGKNVIACQVLFYGSGDGTSPLGIPGFLMKLKIGDEEIVTDRSWKSFLARSWNPGQYKRWYLRSLQENFDARLFPYGWDSPEFTESNEWLPAYELRGSAAMSSSSNGYPNYELDISGNLMTELRERSIPLMRENNISVKRLTEAFLLQWNLPVENYFDMKVPGAYAATPMTPLPHFSGNKITLSPENNKTALLTFEFAEQSVGWPYFTIDAPEGTIVELLVHEAHKPGTDPLINSHFNSWSRFICREGANTFSPFDYESFRWLQLHIRNFNRPVTISNIGMLRRQYDYNVKPKIIISDTVVQKVMNASVNTLYNSAQDIVVDGMARERQQYSGDGSHQLYPLYQAFGETKLPARFITTFSQGMTANGYFLDSWPAYDRLARIPQRELGWGNWGPILDHGVGFCIDTYNYYLYTGDSIPLKEAYPRMVKFFRYLQTIVDKNGLIKVENLGIPCVWIDHIAYKQQKHKMLPFNLYVSAMTGHSLYETARLLGDDTTAAEAKRFSEQILARCIEMFWSSKDRVFIDNKPWSDEEGEIRYSDRTLANALLFHQCPGNDETRSVEILKSFPSEMGVSYPCNAVWRYWALAENGEMGALLYDLRGRWGRMNSVWENNTLQEDWNATHDSGSQWSHSAVAPIVLLYQGIAGAKPMNPGGSRYRIWPKPGDLNLVECDVQTLYGGIGFKTEGSKGKRTLSLTVPQGIEVELWLDSREDVKLEKSGGNDSGISKYIVKGGSKITLKLKYT
ncbi:MAG TPA: alpha-L-rhamnosidase N-terminal domain-containing protein [Bacteroidales bacterium]|nr:alpha-L-rhamnosidase N-terminal domain-containing protein [Bacteroidales bacterium]